MRLRRRLEADAKSLFAFYQYGRLHRAVRLRWGFLDEMIPARWFPPDELCLYGLKRQALEGEKMLEVVVGSAPGWAEPWARAQLCSVVRESRGYGTVLVDDEGFVENVWVLLASGPRRFEKVSLDAAREFRFKPPIVDGKPAQMWIRFQIRFRISG